MTNIQLYLLLPMVQALGLNKFHTLLQALEKLLFLGLRYVTLRNFVNSFTKCYIFTKVKFTRKSLQPLPVLQHPMSTPTTSDAASSASTALLLCVPSKQGYFIARWRACLSSHSHTHLAPNPPLGMPDRANLYLYRYRYNCTLLFTIRYKGP